MSLARDLLSVCPESANVLCISFPGDPGKLSPHLWRAEILPPNSLIVTNPARIKSQNIYLGVSAFKGSRRVKADFVCQLAIMIDDLGEYIPIEKLPPDLRPTWLIETSQGSFQGYWVLRDPITTQRRADGIISALQARGYCKPDGSDTGFVGVTRVGRAEGGINGKRSKRNPDGTPWRVTGERTGDLVTQAQFLDAFNISEDDIKKGKVRRAQEGQGPQGDKDFQQALAEDPLLPFLEEQGLVKEIQDSGWVQLHCPWVSEHTDGRDDGTAYRIARYSGSGRGGFKCHHGSHQDRTVVDLWRWCSENGWINPWGAESEFEVIQDAAPRSVQGALQERLVDQYVWVGSRAAFLNFETGSYTSSESFEATISAHEGVDVHRGKNGATLFGFCEPGEKGKPVFYRAGPWMRYVAQRTVDEVTWDPGEGQIFERNGVRYANLWKPVERYPNASAKLWVDHVYRLYPEDGQSIIEWLAHTVQRPGEKVNHALVLGGPQGSGKNAILVPLEFLPGFTGSATLPEVMSGFGDWAYGHKLTVLNEAKRTKNFTADDVHNALKIFITRPPLTLTINGKYKPIIQVPNLLSVAITTNYVDSLHIDRDDRRYLVCWTDIIPEQAHFDRLFGWLMAGGWREVIGYLQQVSLRDFNPAAPPAWSQATQDMYESGRPEVEVQIERLLAGRLVIAHTDFVYEINSEVDRKVLTRDVTKALQALGWAKLDSGNQLNKGRWFIRTGEPRQYVYHSGEISAKKAAEMIDELRREARGEE